MYNNKRACLVTTLSVMAAAMVGLDLLSSSRRLLSGTLPSFLSSLETRQEVATTRPSSNNNVTDDWIEKCVVDASNISWTPFLTLRKEYTIGDCIRWCRKCDWHEWPQNENYRNQTTIVGTYNTLACPKNHSNYVSHGNLDVLEQILHDFEQEDSTKNFTKPDPDALVIHLRLGDIIEKSQDDVASMLTHGGKPGYWSQYPKSIKSVYEYLNNIHEANTTKVVLVGGSHRPQFFQKSRVYSHCLSQALEMVGIDVSVQLDGGDADFDFYYMTHAKQLVVSSGGFSMLIGEMVKRSGGKLIGRTFNHTTK